ncbi:U11/U12 small nuclear ribonucleoprotein 25 kDa protein [Venturia canescens]|uniref:U11/U12 small nuclear ribonucleoprotein 25 kDa protein n=1 Tax=Venturia canescens TaxID=32260 RepID=UPI001C9CF5DF|nr:U11/U12 small nuclear ribonucleoprotein 25 kDa protein-like [Venturia canescens]
MKTESVCLVNMSDGKDETKKDNVEEKFGRVQFSHEELVKLTKEAIDKLIESDPLLNGLLSDTTAEEIRSQTAVAQGQAITLYLNRGERPILPIVVAPHTTTVLDLKKAIRRYTDLALKRERVKTKISWKHVWKKYQLSFNDSILSDDSANIKNYGISNRTELHFIKRIREKNKRK